MKDNKAKQRARESGHRKDLQVVRNHNQVTRKNNNNDYLIKINLKKIVINYFWYFDTEEFYKCLKYFIDADYEIHLILMGYIKYDFSDKFDPKIFHGPFFGPYGEWFHLIKEENIIYEYDYISAYKIIYEKFKLPLDRFKNENTYIEYEEKLKIFGYLTYNEMEKIYRNNMLGENNHKQKFK